MTPADLIARHKGFTPGPWETQESPSGGLLLIRGNHSDRFKRHPQTHLQIVPEADARLISDAPLMLAALTAQAERIATLERTCAEFAKDEADLVREINELRQGAARYRWLRDHLWSQSLTKVFTLPIVWGVDWPGEEGKKMDAEIDAALAAEGET